MARLPARTTRINGLGHKALARPRRWLEADFIEQNVTTARLVGLGTAVPDHRCAQADIAEFLSRVAEAQPGCPPRFARYVRHLAKSSAIGFRHSVLEDYTRDAPNDFEFFPKNWALQPSPTTAARMNVYRAASVDLAETAARRAMRDAGLPFEEVTHLVLSTCTGFFAPGPDVALMQRLGLSPSVQRSILGFMGCYAGVNGLRAADHIVRAEPDAVVLQIAVELCSLHFQIDADLEQLVSNLLFADGAGAAVYRQRPARRELAPRILRTSSSVSADTLDQMGWEIGDHGFVMRLADQVPRHLHDQAPRFVADMLAGSGLKTDDVSAWAVHPGGKRILEEIGRALALGDGALDPSFDVLRDFGNMSSATILFVLERVLAEWRANDTGAIVALSFGPGLTMEGTVLAP